MEKSKIIIIALLIIGFFVVRKIDTCHSPKNKKNVFDTRRKIDDILEARWKNVSVENNGQIELNEYSYPRYNFNVTTVHFVVHDDKIFAECNNCIYTNDQPVSSVELCAYSEPILTLLNGFKQVVEDDLKGE